MYTGALFGGGGAPIIGGGAQIIGGGAGLRPNLTPGFANASGRQRLEAILCTVGGTATVHTQTSSHRYSDINRRGCSTISSCNRPL